MFYLFIKFVNVKASEFIKLLIMNKIIKNNTTYDDFSISPVIRQVLLHWGYQLTKKDLDQYKKSKKN